MVVDANSAAAYDDTAVNNGMVVYAAVTAYNMASRDSGCAVAVDKAASVYNTATFHDGASVDDVSGDDQITTEDEDVAAAGDDDILMDMVARRKKQSDRRAKIAPKD